MPNCPRCNKPVYFAERVTSIGKDWHRPCLRCENEACKKTLAAGSHSEVLVRANRIAIAVMEHCSDLEDTVMVELSRTLSITVRLERFKHDILADRGKVPNRHVVSYSFLATK